MAFNLERVARAWLAAIQADLPDALDAVEALWTGTDPVTLPNPVNYFLGYKPTIPELPSTSFPWVAVLVQEREPVSTGEPEWGAQAQRLTVYLDFFVVADTEQAANLMGFRYAEAMVRVTQGHYVVEGCRQRNYEAKVTLSNAMRHPKAQDADMTDARWVDFIEMGRIEIQVEG